MRVLEGLEPSAVFHFFEEICGIPHISYHEKELSDYCVNFAKERGYFCTQDEIGNVIIIAEATKGYEEVAPIILQAHLDMVGDKTPDCTLDMEKEAIELQINGDDISAKGTTLGGDDGIAVAYALAILDAKDIPHPRLEVVLTVCEEVGLLGASAIDLSVCTGKRLINIDSEIEGVLTAGCAGGRRITSTIPVTRKEGEGILCELSLEGLLGGHSGIEIDKGRANANLLLARFLLFLQEKLSYLLVSFTGGLKENVIPKNGKVQILVKEEDIRLLEEAIAEFHAQTEAEYGTSDPEIRLVFTKKEFQKENVLDEVSLDKILTILNVVPCGVQTMSADLPGLVETSVNLGIVELKDSEIELKFSLRSSIQSAKEHLARKIQKLTEFFGGQISAQGDYPAWTYARKSDFRNQCVEIFKEQYGKEPEIQILHAGLECGILSSKIEGLDCISFGPNQFDIHTPDERLSISSVGRIWEFLKTILAQR